MAKDLTTVTKNYEKYSELDETHLMDSMEERKRKIIDLANAFLILPGGYGTFEEIGAIVGGQANKLFSKPIAFLNFENFYDTLLAFLDEMYQLKFSKLHYKELFYVGHNIQDILVYFENYSSIELKDKFVE